MNRRQFAAFVGTATVTGLTGGYLLRDWLPSIGDSTTVNHYIRVWNNRETAHEVTVRWSLDEEQPKSRSQTVESDSKWEPAQFRSHSELFVQFYVQGEQVWEDTHEIPTAYGKPGESWVGITLQPTGEVGTQFIVTE
jgi:hypothetical protein